MKKKKILSLFLTLTMIIGLMTAFPTVSHAYDLSGNCGENGGNVQWGYDDDEKALVIYGTGRMKDSPLVSPFDLDVKLDTRYIRIDEGVTYIGAHAFDGFLRLEEMGIADSVTEIGDYAFYQDKSISFLSLPKNVEKIGDYAFAKLDHLFGIQFNNKLKTIGANAFYGCGALHHPLELPASVETIGECAFEDCFALRSAVIYGNVGLYAFRNCGADVVIAGNCTAIAKDAFNRSRATSITIPDTVRTIERQAFEDTANLKELRLPNGLTTIPMHMASDSGITKITIPKSVTRIEDAFANTPLTDVYYTGSYEDWQKIDIENKYGYNDALLNANIHYVQGGDIYFGLSWELNSGTLTIRANPDSSMIGNEQFYGNMVKWGEPEIVPWYGLRDEITSVVIEDGVKDIGNYAFCGCSNLESVTIPSSVTRICKYAFKNCFSLENLTIPDSVTRIDEGAFMNCWISGDITISSGVEFVAQNAFNSVTVGGVTKYNGSKINWDENVNVGIGNKSLLNNLIIFDRDPRGSCSKTDDDRVVWSVHGDTLLITGRGRMEDYSTAADVPWVAYRDRIKKLDIDEEVTAIGKNAFAYHGNLEEVDIMGDITEIGRGAFAYCTSLKNIYLPASVTIMASSNASQNGKYVFNDCTALESIDMDENNETFRQWDGGLYDAELTKIIQYPLGKLQEDFTLPDSVEAITSRAFSGAVHLKTVTIPASVTSIEQWAFDRCDNLTDIYYEGTAYDWAGVYNYDDKVTALYNSGHVHFAELPEDNKCGENVTYELVGGTLNISGTGAMYDYDSFTDTPWYFDKSYIDEVVIGSGVTHIGDHAFYGCDYLGDVTIPDSVTSIGDYAFAKCPYLGMIDFPQYLESIGDYAFWDCTDLMNITIPNTCESLGESAFRGCSSLMTATLSSSLDKVSWAMFCDCDNLTSITIPAGVTEIENNAFNGCTALETVTLPDTVETIGNGAFFGCDDLRYVYYSGSYGDRQNNVKTGAKTRKVNDANWSYGITHSLTLVPAVEPTCSQAGHAAYYECSHCDKIFEDSEAVTETSLANVAIPKKEHNLAYRYAKDATCTDEGCIEHYECIYCHQTFADEGGETPVYDVTTPTVAHDIEWMQPTDATCTGNGYDAHYECTACHKFFTGPEGYTEDIPDTHITAPATGHDWEFTEWLWADDCSFCYGVFICRNDSDHVNYVPAEISMDYGYDEYGNTLGVYTAGIDSESGYYSDIKSRVITYCGALTEEESYTSVNYSIFPDEGELYIDGAVSEEDPVYVALYDRRGKLKEIRIFTEETVDADEIEITPLISKIKIMWWKADSIQPVCENKVIELQ